MTELEHAVGIYGSEEAFEMALREKQEWAADLNAHIEGGGRIQLGGDGIYPPSYLKTGLRFRGVKHYGGHPTALVVCDGEKVLGTCKYPAKA